MDIYLIRHPQSPEAASNRIIGHTDLKAAEGEAFARRVAALLPAPIDLVYASPLARAHEPAKALAANVLKNQYPVQTAADLMELNFGEWENKTWQDIPEAELNPWMEDFVGVAPPAGESFAQLGERVTGFVSALRERARPDATIAMVLHKGPILALLAEALGMPLANAFRLSVDHESVTHIGEQYGQPLVGYVNRLPQAS
jgi:alpha-ribazole phosphatase